MKHKYKYGTLLRNNKGHLILVEGLTPDGGYYRVYLYHEKKETVILKAELEWSRLYRPAIKCGSKIWRSLNNVPVAHLDRA